MTINAINLVPGPNGFPQITATVSATTYIVPATRGRVRWRHARRPGADARQAADLDLRILDHAARRGRHLGAAMSVPRNMLKELVDRKLWPIALVLIIALVAVPVLLTKKAPTDIVTPPTGPLPYSSGTTLPAISVKTSPANSKLAGSGRNPFTPQHEATTADHDRGGRDDPDPGDDHAEHRHRHGSGTSSSTGSGAGASTTPATTPAPPAPRRTDPDHARAGTRAQARAHRPDRRPSPITCHSRSRPPTVA